MRFRVGVAGESGRFLSFRFPPSSLPSVSLPPSPSPSSSHYDPSGHEGSFVGTAEHSVNVLHCHTSLVPVPVSRRSGAVAIPGTLQSEVIVFLLRGQVVVLVIPFLPSPPPSPSPSPLLCVAIATTTVTSDAPDENRSMWTNVHLRVVSVQQGPLITLVILLLCGVNLNFPLLV